VRKKKSQEGGGASAPWLTTYADTVTLLLAFFVLLFAFSSVDVEKFRAVISAFQGSVSVLDGGRTISGEDILNQQTSELEMMQLRELYEQLQEFIEEEQFEGSVHLELEERGLTVRFADQVFFDLGRATLKPESLQILQRMAPLLRTLPNPIRVEGHTDNLPIRTSQFPSNWELSVHRATTVIRYLIEEQSFDPQKLSATGYGEYRPLKPNTSEENRAQNRRVDIVIMRIDLWDEEPN